MRFMGALALCVWPMVATVVTLLTAQPQLPGRGWHMWIYCVVTSVWQEYIVYWQFWIIKQITRKITWIFNLGWLCAYLNYLINVPWARSCLSADRDGLWWQCSAIRSRAALNCKPLLKKGIFKIIKAKKNVLTNYIIKFQSGGSFFYFRQECCHSMCTNGWGSAGTHTQSGNLAPSIVWQMHLALAPTGSYPDHNCILAWWPHLVLP